MEPSHDVLFECDTEYFEWDSAKAERNIANHGVTFEEAATAFADPDQVMEFDEAHSVEEDRSVLFGRSSHGRLLVVVWTLRRDRNRLISARRATASEIRQYEQRD